MVICNHHFTDQFWLCVTLRFIRAENWSVIMIQESRAIEVKADVIVIALGIRIWENIWSYCVTITISHSPLLYVICLFWVKQLCNPRKEKKQNHVNVKCDIKWNMTHFLKSEVLDTSCFLLQGHQTKKYRRLFSQ